MREYGTRSRCFRGISAFWTTAPTVVCADDRHFRAARIAPPCVPRVETGRGQISRALASLRYGFVPTNNTASVRAAFGVATSSRLVAASKYAAPVDVWLARMHGAAPKVSDTLNTLPCARGVTVPETVQPLVPEPLIVPVPLMTTLAFSAPRNAATRPVKVPASAASEGVLS